MGHGECTGDENEYSSTCFNENELIQVIFSNIFREYLDNWESDRKVILVESCHSGNWADDFDDTPYVVISTSDETHDSESLSGLPGEGKFSHYFFEHINDGYNFLNSYYYAEPKAWYYMGFIEELFNIKTYQNLKMYYNTGYSWFGSPSSWFED